jgi:sugar phosphate isomerase/epimerase
MSYTRVFSSLGCPELNLEGVFALASRHGLAGVELRALAGSVDLPRHFREVYRTPTALADFVRGQSIQIPVLDTSLHLAGDSDPERKAFLEYIPWAEELGVPYLRVFDGKAPVGADEFAMMLETIDWWRALRAANHWRTDIIVETHDSLFTGARLQRLLTRAPDTKVLWDAHHTWKRGGEDPLVTWNAIRNHVAHLHVKDSVTVGTETEDYRYVLPGEREFPMKPLREALAVEFSEAVSLEWERLWIPTLGPVEDALSAANEHGWW